MSRHGLSIATAAFVLSATAHAQGGHLSTYSCIAKDGNGSTVGVGATGTVTQFSIDGFTGANASAVIQGAARVYKGKYTLTPEQLRKLDIHLRRQLGPYEIHVSPALVPHSQLPGTGEGSVRVLRYTVSGQALGVLEFRCLKQGAQG